MRRYIAATGQNERPLSALSDGAHQQWVNGLSPTRRRLLNDLSPEMKKVFLSAQFTSDTPLTEAESVVLAEALKALTTLFADGNSQQAPLTGDRTVAIGAIHTFWEKCLREEPSDTAPSVQFSTPMSPKAKLLAENLLSTLERLERVANQNESDSEEALRISQYGANEAFFRHRELLTTDQLNAFSRMMPAPGKLFCTALITADPALSSEKSNVLSEALIAIDTWVAAQRSSQGDVERANVLVVAMLHAFWEPSLQAQQPPALPPEDRIPGDVSAEARFFLDHFMTSTSTSLQNIERASPLAQRPRTTRGDLNYRPMTLNELNFGGEQPEQLITVPAMGHHGLNQVRVPVDEASRELRGREYLEFLTNDIRLSADISTLIQGRHILSARPPRPTETLENIAERLRPVMAQLYRNPELATEIDRIANDTRRDCSDRFDFFLSQMENAALLAHLSTGAIDETVLYNRGISFFLLDEIRAAVGRLYEELHVNPAHQDQSVHDHLNAVYYLQDELRLPHRHARPRYINDRSITIVGPQQAQRIKEIVRERAIASDGMRAINFMATWDPWVAHLKKQDALQRDPHFDQIMTDFQQVLEETEARRLVEGSVENRMDPISYAALLGDKQARLHEWETEVAADHTKKFLFNHRADYLADLGQLPAYFESGV